MDAPPTTPQTQPTEPTPLPPQKRRGCFFYGCIISLVLLVILGVGAYFSARYFVREVAHKTTSFIDDFTEKQPLTLPPAEANPGASGQLQKRIAAFGQALSNGTNAPALILTSDDLNTWLGSLDDTGALKDRMHFDIQGSQLRSRVSVPLDDIKVPLFDLKGRYLNGTAVFSLGLTNGELAVKIDSFEVKGKPLPKEFLAMIQAQNFAAQLQDDPTNAAAIGRIGSIQIRDGKVIVQAKTNTPARK